MRTIYPNPAPIRKRLTDIETSLKKMYVSGEIPYIDKEPKKTDYGLPDDENEILEKIQQEKYPRKNTLLGKLFGPGRPIESPTEYKYLEYKTDKRAFEFWNRFYEVSFWDSLDGHEFEIVVAAIYHYNGYKAKISDIGADGGIDIILSKDDTIYAVQCKALNVPVSQSVVRDLYGTMQRRGIKNGIIVSKNGFSKPSIEFAKDISIKLVDLDGLKRLMPISHREFFKKATELVAAKHYHDFNIKSKKQLNDYNKEKSKPSSLSAVELRKETAKLKKQQKELEKQKAELEKQKEQLEKKNKNTSNSETEAQTTKNLKLVKKSNMINLPNNSIPIVQFDDDGNMIKVYPSINTAVRETGINSKSIRDALNGVQIHAGGYLWDYY